MHKYNTNEFVDDLKQLIEAAKKAEFTDSDLLNIIDRLNRDFIGYENIMRSTILILTTGLLKINTASFQKKIEQFKEREAVALKALKELDEADKEIFNAAF